MPVAPLVLVSGPTEKAERGSPDRPVTSVDVFRPVAELPLVTGCAFAVALALRPDTEGAGEAGALGVTVAAGVLVVVGALPAPMVRGAPMRPVSSALSTGAGQPSPSPSAKPLDPSAVR